MQDVVNRQKSYIELKSMLQKIGILYAKIAQILRKKITNTMSMAGRGREVNILLITFYSHYEHFYP